jgi:GT2 family glycosyltransferase
MYNSKRLGVAVTTYSDKNTTPHRYAIINNCFETLASVSGVTVNIISDGITPRHRKIIEGYPQFNHIERAENGGVAKAKNTSIRVLLEQNIDIGFLVDDDLIFKHPGAFIAYAIAVMKTGIPHFCYFEVDHPNESENIVINNYEIRKTRFVMGSFLTFTPELIDKVGGFRVFDYGYGHEHSNFTLRCIAQGHIPFFCDIKNPMDYLRMDFRSMMGDYGKSIVVDWDRCRQNEIESSSDLTEHYPLIE